MDKALRFLHKMELVDIKPNVVTYNYSIKGYCDLNQVEDTLELIVECHPRDVPLTSPDVVTCTAIVDGFRRMGKTDEAKNMQQNMYKHGCKPNTVS
ncbi:hypothetical protein AHAS_Ahas07G0047300 [Arachis hypogaea]